MNSEVHLEVLHDDITKEKARRETQDAKESRIADEASEAISFDRHPFWQMMKKDLEEVREGIIRRIMNDENMPKELIDRLRIKANDIKLFLEHPKMYVKRLQDLIAKKRPR